MPFFLGKAHIRRAILGHEEALRIYSLCHHLNKLEILEDILKASHQRSLNKSSENENEDEFTDYIEAPDIIRKSVVLLESSTAAVKCVWGLEVFYHHMKNMKFNVIYSMSSIVILYRKYRNI